MKHQQVSVDYWAMGKAMITYGVLTMMGWMMLRLFNAVFTLPRRMRAQHNNIQHTLEELRKRFPDLNVTEEDILNAEKEVEEILKEDEMKRQEAKKEMIEGKEKNETQSDETPTTEESKKTL